MKSESSDGDLDRHPAEDAERLEHEVDEIRVGLEEKVSELSRRRHRVKELTAQARSHPWAIAAAGAVLVGGGAGLVLWRRRRAREVPALGPQLVASARAARAVLAAKLAGARGRAPARSRERQPERQVTGRTVAMRILMAAGTAAASVLARQAARRLLKGGSS